jgi:RNA-binding protein
MVSILHRWPEVNGSNRSSVEQRGGLHGGGLAFDTRHPGVETPRVEKLPNPQLRVLKAKAQLMEPTLKLGKAGLSEGFLKTVNETIDLHELVKVKLDDFKDQKKELAKELVAKTNSHLVIQVGHVIVLYRQQPDPAKRKIQF